MCGRPARRSRNSLTDKIGKVAPEVGWTFPPEIQFFEVHNYFAGNRRRG